MKTPWKILARLTRRPPGRAQDSSTGNDTDSKALESEVEHTYALPPSPTVPAEPPAQDEDASVEPAIIVSDEAKGDDDLAQTLRPPIDAEEVQKTARRETGHMGAEANSSVAKGVARTKSQSKPRIKRRERGRRANAHIAAQSPADAKHHPTLQPSSPRDVFFHEMGTLDEEIKMLRTQLAQKVHLQNVQLKKMLERFEGS